MVAIENAPDVAAEGGLRSQRRRQVELALEAKFGGNVDVVGRDRQNEQA